MRRPPHGGEDLGAKLEEVRKELHCVHGHLQQSCHRQGLSLDCTREMKEMMSRKSRKTEMRERARSRASVCITASNSERTSGAEAVAQTSVMKEGFRTEYCDREEAQCLPLPKKEPGIELA